MIKFLFVLTLFSFVQTFFLNDRWGGSNKNDELILLHVIFRHGNRTPLLSELYPNDPYLNYTYEPYGRGQLTDIGKHTASQVGKNLRQRYDKFLGYNYNATVKAQSTNVTRTKMTLEFVLRNLYPSDRKFLYEVKSRNEDRILAGTACPNYEKWLMEVANSPAAIEEYEKYKEIFEYLTKNTGKNMSTFHDTFDLYFGLSAEEEWGFILPPWTEPVWPQDIREMAVKYYFIGTANENLKKLASGYFLGKLINDTQTKINNKNNKKKLYLYSAHESNIAHLLIVLNIFEPPHIPRYGSYLMFEIRKRNSDIGIMVFYQNYVEQEPVLLKLPNCKEFCPLKQFIKLVEDHIPPDSLCGN